ncbi:MAG: hypothetical protein ACU0CO_06520 [Shimia sp.]
MRRELMAPTTEAPGAYEAWFADLKSRAFAAGVGLLALGLAVFVIVLDEWGPNACARASISHYFYEPAAGVFFVWALAFVGTFMLAYEGRPRSWDPFVASAGGIGAFLVALAPTSGFGCLEAAGTMLDLRPGMVLPFEALAGVPSAGAGADEALTLTGPVTVDAGAPWKRWVHFAGAAIVLLALLYFAAWAFPRATSDLDRAPGGGLTRTKKLRNAWYYGLAAVMVAGFGLILGDLLGAEGWVASVSRALDAPLALLGVTVPDGPRPTFHGEMLILGGFGASWLTKGRATGAIARVWQIRTREAAR